MSLNEKNVSALGRRERRRQLALVLGCGSRGEPREAGRGAAVDFGDRAGIVPQGGRATISVQVSGSMASRRSWRVRRVMNSRLAARGGELLACGVTSGAQCLVARIPYNQRLVQP